MSQFTINPLSTKGPTDREKKQNEALTQWLQDQGCFENHDELLLREEVLLLLVELIKSWVKKVAAHKGMSELAIEEANAHVLTFGSFRLGVHGPGDDIDTHCIGPKWCERHGDFFGSNAWSLQYLLSQNSSVKKIQAVPDSFVPVLKLDILGIDIDLTYAQLPQPEVPLDLNVQNDNILRGMDEESVTSINGCRVTDKIVQLVPNKESFSNALRFLKLWGKRRGIYSNVMGYLGGVNFAMLVTYVCMLHPNACASTIVNKFFHVYCLWPWNLPVRLTEIKTGGSMAQMVWDPAQNRRDSVALFPIITPCYPASNSTYNVSECTKAIMLAEFERGKTIVSEKPNEPMDLDNLAQTFDFFSRGTFMNYIQITVSAASQEGFQAWSGYMASKIKHMATKIQNMLAARPWPKEFAVPRELCEDGRLRSVWFIGVRKKPTNAALSQFAIKKVDLRAAVADFKTFCTRWPYKKIGMTVDVTVVKFPDLPPWLFKDNIHPEDVSAAEPLSNTPTELEPGMTNSEWTPPEPHVPSERVWTRPNNVFDKPPDGKLAEQLEQFKQECTQPSNPVESARVWTRPKPDAEPTLHATDGHAVPVEKNFSDTAASNCSKREWTRPPAPVESARVWTRPKPDPVSCISVPEASGSIKQEPSGPQPLGHSDVGSKQAKLDTEAPGDKKRTRVDTQLEPALAQSPPVLKQAKLDTESVDTDADAEKDCSRPEADEGGDVRECQHVKIESKEPVLLKEVVSDGTTGIGVDELKTL